MYVSYDLRNQYRTRRRNKVDRYAAFASACRVRGKGRNRFDIARTWARLAAMDGNRTEFERSRTVFGVGESQAVITRDMEAPVDLIWAFWQGDWQTLGSASPGEIGVFPELAPLISWARLESSAASPQETLEKSTRFSENPETQGLARLLRTRCYLETGQPGRARAEVEAVRVTLEKSAREEIEDFVWLPLLEWLQGMSLLSLNSPQATREHFERTALLAPRSWMAKTNP